MARRPVVLGGALALLIVAAVAVWFLVRPGYNTSPEALVHYFPQREATVLYLDVGALRASGILEKLVGSTVGEDPAYRGFVQDSGFDYKRDLERAMLNSAGGLHYFVLQGKFDWKKLRSYAATHEGSCRGDDCHMKGSTPDRVISWRKLNANVMALASTRDETGAQAIAPRKADEPLGWDVPRSPLWLEVPSQVLQSLEQLPPGTRVFARALQPAKRAVFTVAPEASQFALGIDVVCRNAEDAAVLRTQLEGLTKMLTSLIQRENKTPSATDLSSILTSGRFERQDKRVLGRWSVPRVFVESLGSGS